MWDLVGKPRGRPPKFPKHCVEVEGVIKISDGSDSDSEDMDCDSNSSPESLQDNDDVIFVNHIDGPTGKLGSVVTGKWNFSFVSKKHSLTLSSKYYVLLVGDF